MADAAPDPTEPKKYHMRDVAKILRMQEWRIRAYEDCGYYPQRIREFAEQGGFWLQEDVDEMKRRRLRAHRYKVPAGIREFIKSRMPPKPKEAEGEDDDEAEMDPD